MKSGLEKTDGGVLQTESRPQLAERFLPETVQIFWIFTDNRQFRNSLGK